MGLDISIYAVKKGSFPDVYVYNDDLDSKIIDKDVLYFRKQWSFFEYIGSIYAERYEPKIKDESMRHFGDLEKSFEAVRKYYSEESQKDPNFFLNTLRSLSDVMVKVTVKDVFDYFEAFFKGELDTSNDCFTLDELECREGFVNECGSAISKMLSHPEVDYYFIASY